MRSPSFARKSKNMAAGSYDFAVAQCPINRPLDDAVARMPLLKVGFEVGPAKFDLGRFCAARKESLMELFLGDDLSGYLTQVRWPLYPAGTPLSQSLKRCTPEGML